MNVRYCTILIELSTVYTHTTVWVYIVYCNIKQDTVHCTVYSAHEHCTMYVSITSKYQLLFQDIFLNIYCKLTTKILQLINHCTLYAIYNAQCIMFSVLFDVYTIQYRTLHWLIGSKMRLKLGPRGHYLNLHK